jgi:Putative zinc-finger
MTADFSRHGGPQDIGAPRPSDAEDPYVRWDASYVLGSLSSAERHEYEDHLAACPSCRAAVSELSGMPALLALLDRDEMALADDERPAEPPPLRPEVLAALLQKVSWRRRRSRWLTWSVSAAAAVVLAIGVFVALRPVALTPDTASPRMSTTAMTMAPVVPSELAATVSVTSHDWGTHVEMACTYREWPDDTGHDHDETGDKLAMVVVGHDGSRTQLATWMALPAATALPTGSTSMPIDQIATIQVVSTDSGNVLLQRSL